MNSTFLVNELTNLASEAKRKNNELRSAAEKSLQELKSLPTTSEQQLAADLSRRPAFIEPFLIACGSRNAKFAGSGVACLQRLIISRGLPKGRLQQALEAFKACTDLGLDVQLKILQALPSLLQNYADDLRGDLLRGALEVCASLQGAKVSTVSGVAAATLQQLLSSVFEKVAHEDKRAGEIQPLIEVPLDDGSAHLGPAAFDAYRAFRDLALAAEGKKAEFVQFTSLPQESILELVWSCINANPQLFGSHPELASIVRSNVLPLVTRAFSDKLSFPVTLRYLRILDLVLGRYITQFANDCVVTLGVATHSLDPDAATPWKRAMTMEMLRNFFVHGNNIIDAYAAFDMAVDRKPIVQNLMSAFVRLSSEKPSAIGLGQQSTVPLGPTSPKDSASDQTPTESPATMAGIISSALGVAEANVAGISSRWSIPRTTCLEQLDKTEAPAVPETYIYALVLECMSSLSESLAKVVLPLTVHHERPKARLKDDAANGQLLESASSGRTRSQSFRKRAVPLNPLEQDDNEGSGRVRTVNALVESCWPAVLATSSTFLNAALDDQYYRNLVKAYQRFAQVAGLLRLTTARDALMTTLGKAAVPPHVLNSALAEPPKTPSGEVSRVFSNPISLLSVDSLVSQASALSLDRDRRGSTDPPGPILTTRNLLCLRALLNLAIALGPTLDTAFAVVVGTLKQADIVLSATSPQQMVRQNSVTSRKGSELPDAVQAFSNEVTAVEAAASRLLESTADYPNEAFLNVLNIFCNLLHPNLPASPRPDQVSPPATPTLKSRTYSGLGLGGFGETQTRDYKFVIPKLGNLLEINVSRFASGDPAETGWNVFVDELVSLTSNNTTPKEARRAATGVLCKVAADLVSKVIEDDVDTRATIQRRTFAVLLRQIDGIYAEDGELTGGDIEVQGYVVDALQAILERCGESLVAGWNRTIAIISSVFERSGAPPDRQDDEETHIDWEHVSKDLVSVKLGRTAFAATQLICSDFLSALPTTVTPALIELLYRFASQTQDLNTSLTTITMTWNVSDFLLNTIVEDELDVMARRVKEADDFEDEVQSELRNSASAQWLLLLFRLQEIINTGHKEVRKAAFQTICSIFKNNGEKMSPSTWDLTLRSIILRISFSDVFLYHSGSENDDANGGQGVLQDEMISNTIISGTSEVIAHHLPLIQQVAQLPSLWEAFLSRLEAYLDLENHTLNTAVYLALTKVLSRIGTNSKIWAGPMYRTLHLWMKRNPASVEVDDKKSNQDSLVAYVDAGTELYRLTQQSLSTSQTRTLVENLYLAIRHADGPRYGADVSSPSPLQRKAFELLKTIRSDSPSTLLVVGAKLLTLHHDTAGERPSDDGPTYVAIASEAIDWVQGLVTMAIDDEDLLETGVLTSVIQSLRRIIEEKYAFKLEHQGLPLWRKATTAVLALSVPLLEQCQKPSLNRSVKILVWTEFVQIAGGIVKSNGMSIVEDKERIYADETADIESFKSLRQVLIPRLGDADLPDKVRWSYARSLFDASIIHPTEKNELPDAETSPLQNIARIRRGRVKRVPHSRRERMCYECLSELINLANKDDGSAECEKLMQAAAPLLILRLAIPVRAYIADQPLRGRRPQPLSELEELLFSFEAIRNFKDEPVGRSADLDAVGQTGRKTVLHHLYPLLVEAVNTAGDRWSGSDEVLIPLQRVLAASSPAP